VMVMSMKIRGSREIWMKVKATLGVRMLLRVGIYGEVE